MEGGRGLQVLEESINSGRLEGTSIVKLIVEIIEPFHGKIFDPACGSGGMFVQSAQFVRRHQKRAAEELTVFGTEKANHTVKLAKMNLAVHGLSGDIRESNTPELKKDKRAKIYAQIY